jgi:dynein heavy chain
LEVEHYRKAFSSEFPEIDSPEIFGLHPNADLTFRVKETTKFIDNLTVTQPKQTGGGSGATLEDVVMEKADELLEKIPEDYVEDEYKARIRKLGGMDIPLNIFLYQEIQRLQRVIKRVRHMLITMQQAIRGEVVLTNELQEAMGTIFDARVPKPWVFTPGGDEFSWILPTLGLWFASLLERDLQNRTWLNSERPNSYWMTGFFNPQGFLTAMKQEVTRLHKAESWALDDVAYYTEVTEFERLEQVRSKPKEGVYIHGLFLDGAAWSKSEGSLVESAPKELFAALPVLYVTAKTKSELRNSREMFGTMGPYECPCYKYRARTDRYLIFMVNLVTKSKRPRHWILRGVALLCQTAS